MINNINMLLDELDKNRLSYIDSELIHNLNHMRPYDLYLFHTEDFFSCLDLKCNQYMFHYNNRDYPFKFLSEEDIQKVDKEILLNLEKRRKHYFNRTLKLAGSMDLVNPKVIIGSNKTHTLASIISYETSEEEMIIDYVNNIIMRKRDYYDLFNMKEINVISKYELYQLYILFVKLDKPLVELLFFSKEMLKDISKNIHQFEDKYNEIGINNAIFSICSAKSDSIFYSSLDLENCKYDSIRREIDNFTMNPNKKTKHIKKVLDKDNHYTFKSYGFPKFEFGLISALLVDSSDMAKELTSKERYGQCHLNVISIVRALNKKQYDSSFIVSGKIRRNDKDYILHSWVEIEIENDKTVVLDYNHNLIINKDKYYKLYGAVEISKTKSSDYIDIVYNMNENQMYFNGISINYFGKELCNDFLRNEKIFTKK